MNLAGNARTLGGVLCMSWWQIVHIALFGSVN
jgi:hypothetical protein